MPEIARKAGAYVVEINVERTELTGGAHETITAPAAQALPEILETVRRLHPAIDAGGRAYNLNAN
jgi:NAD-dependent SIR2 family protein deacetylase